MASWLRHLSQESPDIFARIVGSLKDGVLDGLIGFKLVKAGETTRILKSEFEFTGDASDAANSSFLLNFDQLSDGQRNLVALFTVLHSAVEADSTLCLDEPDNYVALREIQPWLIELIDRTRETGSQCLLISHHPEFINYLAPTEGVRFFRDNGPVRDPAVPVDRRRRNSPGRDCRPRVGVGYAMPNMQGVQVILLVEDEALERFAYRVLLDLGFERRKIRVNRSPKGKGSGKQWVTQRFPVEVQAQRRKAHHLNVALVIGTDADELTVTQRVRELDTTLEAFGLDKRGPEERICLLIPKWHIETWILHLNGRQVAEDEDYKKDVKVQDVIFRISRDFVERYRDWKHGVTKSILLPAMIAAFEELNRLDL